MKVWIVTEAQYSTYLGAFTEKRLAANSVWQTHKEAQIVMGMREISPSLLHIDVHLTAAAKDGNVPVKTYIIEEVEVLDKAVPL